MTPIADLKGEVHKIFTQKWSQRKGRAVPESDQLGLGNDAVVLNGTVLYADMSDSTGLVDSQKAWFAARIYKAHLCCAARIIRSESGSITAYDGDRIMAVFIGDRKNSRAARAALKINYAIHEIINPAIRGRYPSSTYEVQHTVGIDSGNLFVARTGVRGANDLVWVGAAANYAAKLCELPNDYPSAITDRVYDRLARDAQYSEGNELMWRSFTWRKTGETIYRSDWMWPPE